MTMSAKLELIAIRTERGVELASPGVGWLSEVVREGTVLSSGMSVGRLSTLGVVRELVVPDGVLGVVRSKPPERLHHPLGYKAIVYALDPLTENVADATQTEARRSNSTELVVRAPSSGRYWHRPSPNDPPLVAEGLALSEGTPIGLIEVMKTFTQVAYRPSGGLPSSAKIVRLLAADGAEVAEGDALFEVAAR
jgi:acetyl-CoA carboxylase biotin carboxyl carrier protein